MRTKRRVTTPLLGAAVAGLAFFGATASAETVVSRQRPVSLKVTDKSRALLPIVVSDKASPRVLAAARTLGDYLGRISGGAFTIETKPAPVPANQPGLLVGVAADFADKTILSEAKGATHTEDYLLRTSARGATIAGASDLGVEHAVWDFLRQLGYRQFFPGDKWEIVPRIESISVSVNKVEHPDYFARRIWPGFGTSKPNYAEWLAWCARNRVATGIDLVTGHAYNTIILRNQKEFDAHPEYYALVKGKRAAWNGGKFCISNPDLRRLVVEDSLRQFAQNPNLQSISLDPSDGGDWCECPLCLAMGSVTDRVVTLANEVATAVTAKYPDKFIGIYAYNEHSPPPTIKVHPHVVVSIATAYIRGGFTLDQLLDGWSKKAELFGIREYYSFYKWDWDLAGLARGGNLDYLKETTPRFYKSGARFMNSESSDNWGPNGLGYYVASRLLWNTADATRIDSLRNDFLDKCFGPARAPMAEWYRLIDGSNKPLLTPDLVGRLYRELDKALKLTDDDAIRARILDLALYVRYMDNAIATGARKPSLEQSMRFVWRIYPTHMVHTAAIWTVSASALPPEAAASVPEDKNPWKSKEPYSPDEIRAFIAEGIANNKIADFNPVAFSRDLVPATPLHLPAVAPGDFGFFRGESNFYTWASKNPTTFTFNAQSGIATGAIDGPATFSLFPAAEVMSASVSSANIARDNKNTYPVQLKTGIEGQQSVVLKDGGAGTRVAWPDGVPLTFETSMRWQHKFNGKWSMYFYVPRGTRVLGGYQSGAGGQVLGPDGKSKLTLGQGVSRDYWSVPIAAGEDGKLWKLEGATGEVRLLTVPPYLARNERELLLPREVVKSDSARP